ncbi:DUF1501 domain-containing protein [Aquirhabdus parva]|uniref:DUF1501 domain-containing protein n=1 Tax=Aquirhabdus parva TaxID=2283318 RepID=A0A345P5T0_9GAMM|nr:DUF1501 domain-containing protein [Aquirhabdus parva]AXI02639.1 DUF1501 domain-containing protein [Aquirhabdus parva]
MIHRREFLKLALAASATSLSLSVHQAFGFESPSGSSNGRVIVIFQRGGLDGLFAIAPIDDPQLPILRPTLAKTVLASGIRLGQTGFAAHPSCTRLAELFNAGELSFAPCAGTTDKSRSHFQAQDFFELGTGQAHGNSGFMARTARILGGSDEAISFTQQVPLSFQGLETPPEIAPLTGTGLKLPSGRLREAILLANQNAKTGQALQQAITTEAEIESSMGMDVTAARGAAAVNGFPKIAGQMGRLLRANQKLSLAFIDLGGFDTHVSEDGILTRSLDNFSEGLIALKESLGAEEWNRTHVIVMTEFGRTVRENGTQGTDHGHGGLALLLGGNIQGGKMLGGFHGLSDQALNENRDLPVLVDWRDLLGHSMRHIYGLNQQQLSHIFPEHGFRNIT